MKDRHCSQVVKVRLFKGEDEVDVFSGLNVVAAKAFEKQVQATIDISSLEENDWDRLQLEVEVSILGGQDTLIEVTGAEGLSAASFSVRVLDPRTKFRLQKWGKPATSLCDKVVVDIDKSAITGSLYIWTEVLLREGVKQISRNAFRPGSRLVIGDPIVVAVDDAPRIPGAGFDIIWGAFNDCQKNALYRLEFENADTGKPVLYFNNRHAAVKSIIDSAGTRGMCVRVRDILYSCVASEVWAELVEWALEQDGEGEDASDRHKKIIRSVCKMLQVGKDDLAGLVKYAEGRQDLRLGLQNQFELLEKVNKAAQEVPSKGE